jgi:hypothetical protein
MRDATDFTPSGKGPWWQELPPAAESDWADRAARRANREAFRVACIWSKHRLSRDPEPRCLEVVVPEGQPWSLRDVTAALLDTGQREQRHAAFLRDDRIYRAIEALTDEIRTRQAQGQPMSKTEAITFLCARELTREDAREHIDRWAGKRWTLEQIRDGEGKQAAYVLRSRPTAVEQVS